MREEFQWVQKYRPHTVAECILPASLKDRLLGTVNQGEIPTSLYIGGPGIGKSTVAKALVEEIDCDWYWINGSLKGNIDTLRTDIASFASSVSFKGKRKYVILDEADGLTVATQPALRSFMEEFSRNCGFILTANYPNKIIKELKSRCSVIDFTFPKAEAPKLAMKFFQRVDEILKKEHIDFEQKTLVKAIEFYYPDFRRTLHEIQSHSVTGKFVWNATLANNISLDDITQHMKNKDTVKIREWAATNSLNNEEVFRAFYNKSEKYFDSAFSAELILLIGRYQYQQAFVADAEINLAAFLIEAAAEASWRD